MAPGTALRLSIAASYLAHTHVAIPCALARRGPRVGWRTGRAKLANRLGLIPVGIGAAGLVWCYVVHYPRDYTVAVSLIPEHVLRAGPYRLSRNPMYLAEGAMWFGWSLFFGSPVVLVCSSAFAAFVRYAVGREEKTLQSHFGEAWQEYKERVPRWV